MRLIIKFSPIEGRVSTSLFLNKFTIQGMFYSIFLKSEKLKNKHEEKGFKFFCFSDVFSKDEYYYILFSSPSKEFVMETYNIFKRIEYFYIGYNIFRKIDVKKLNFKIGKKIDWITGSPVVVYYNNKPFSFLKDRDYSIFFARLKENAIKKYTSYYSEPITIEELFDKVNLKKSVAIPLQKDRKKFVIFGSMWNSLEKSYIPKEERKFYQFLLDAGIGEKNSLGFGFINPKIKRFP